MPFLIRQRRSSAASLEVSRYARACPVNWNRDEVSPIDSEFREFFPKATTGRKIWTVITELRDFASQRNSAQDSSPAAQGEWLSEGSDVGTSLEVGWLGRNGWD
jgi:hypothetical protein